MAKIPTAHPILLQSQEAYQIIRKFIPALTLNHQALLCKELLDIIHYQATKDNNKINGIP